MFEDDFEAVQFLKNEGFTFSNGCIKRPYFVTQMSPEEEQAVLYLCDEWDYTTAW